MPSTSFMGATIRRREDPRLITGSSTYVDDIQLPAMVYMGVVRSPHAHARIVSIDAEAALALPGVIAVVTGDDVKHLAAGASEEDEDPLEHRDEESGGEESGGGERPPLAIDVARYAGEGVAAVLAESHYIVEDALELIEVEYEPLPAFVDMESTPEFDTDFPDAKTTDDPRPVGTERVFSWGDVEAAFRDPDVVITERLVNQRLAPLPMETRGVIAQYQSSTGELTVHNSTQCAQFVRDAISDAFNLSRTAVRVIAPEVGGGFGCKIGKYPEDILASYFAITSGRPVKWIESRSENFLDTTHGRAHIGTISLAAGSDGRLTGLKFELLVDSGAYDAGWLCFTTSGMVTGCYDIPNGRTLGKSILTNKTPLGAYRGAGRPEAAFFIERGMDLLAAKLGLDPAEVRRLNFVKPDAFPYKAPDWPVFDSGEYKSTMEAALERSGLSDLLRERDEARSQGRLMGVGFASYVEVTGFGWDTSTVTIEADGTAIVYTGVSPHGQGQETTFAQICGRSLRYTAGRRPCDLGRHQAGLRQRNHGKSWNLGRWNGSLPGRERNS